MPAIPSKLPRVGTTIFTTMSALAAQHGAVNLGQGFPDFPMDPALHELVAKAMRDNYNQYAPMPGHLPLREALAEKFHYLYGCEVDPETEITITPGGTYAIYSAFTTILQPGDEVIVLEPAYDSYIPNIEVNGGVAVRVALNGDFSIPWQAVESAMGARTRAIVLNSPHNPTGSVLREDDIRELQRLAAKQDFFIISDEVYEHLVFDGLEHHSMLRYADLRARSFVCFSFGKTYHCTGWKLGYCVAPPETTLEFRKVHQYNSFSCFTPTQVALAAFLQERGAYLNLGAEMQAKRDLFIRRMAGSRFDLMPSSGSYFICAGYEKISDLPDLAFARQLTVDHGVAVIPVSAFYQEASTVNRIRFCFAKSGETLERATEKLVGL